METSTWALSLDGANTLHNFAIAALAVGALVTILAIMTLIWTNDIRNRFTSAQIANVQAQSDQAKAEAARANERTAELLLQTQQARLEQEKARLEHEHVQAASSGRRISSDQAGKIVKVLQGHAFAVDVLIPSNDPEATQFAEDIIKTLKDAGVAAIAAPAMFPIPLRGLGMTMTNSDGGTALYAALKAAGLQVRDLPERDKVMIVVGGKPTAS